jgi:hypothetical protein
MGRFSLRHARAAAALALVSTSFGPAGAAADTPDFIPKPSGVFTEFTALEQPRADLPVGALWVQGFGPFGAGARADNLETIRSLSSLALNREMQLRLTIGIATLLNLDPGYRSKLSARFSDLTVVRVKDPSKLEGPQSEPRIYEALKAGTITITTDSDLSADLNGSISAAGLPVLGRGDNGRIRSFTVDGKDMFIAFRVVTSKTITSKVEEERLAALEDGPGAALHGHKVQLDAAELNQCLCPASTAETAEACVRDKPVTIKVRKEGTPGEAASGEPRAGGAARFPLRLPVADGEGGVYTSLSITADLQVAPTKGKKGDQPCSFELSRKSRVLASLEGARAEALREPKGKGW